MVFPGARGALWRHARARNRSAHKATSSGAGDVLSARATGQASARQGRRQGRGALAKRRKRGTEAKRAATEAAAGRRKGTSEANRGKAIDAGSHSTGGHVTGERLQWRQRWSAGLESSDLRDGKRDRDALRLCSKPIWPSSGSSRGARSQGGHVADATRSGFARSRLGRAQARREARVHREGTWLTRRAQALLEADLAELRLVERRAMPAPSTFVTVQAFHT